MSTQLHPQVDPQMNPQVSPQVDVSTPPVSSAPVPSVPSVSSSPIIDERLPDRRLTAGVVLIAFGLLALLATFINSDILGLSILPILGVTFIVWGLLARLAGVMIPGGILTGLGLGVLLTELAFSSMPGETRGGIIVLGLGIGFLLILPLTWLVTPVRHWWALIPGGILATIGMALMAGGPALNALTVIGRFWPLIPIAVGALLIWQMLRKR